MSNKFLQTSGNDSNLSDGSVDVLAATLGAVNLQTSMPLKTNSTKQLVSSKLDISDINTLQSQLDATITTPYTGVIQASDFKTDEYNSIDAEIQKINNLTASTPGFTNVTGTLRANTISALAGGIGISSSVLLTGDIAVSSEISNDSFISTGTETSFLTPVLIQNTINCQQVANFENGTDHFDTNLNQVNIADMRNLFVTTAATIKNITCQGPLLVSAPTGVVDVNMILSDTGTFQLQKVNGLDTEPVISVNDLSKVDIHLNLDMNNQSIVNLSNINGLTAANGIYAGISDSIVVDSGNSPGSLVPISGVGFLTVPGDTFQVGASYHLVCAGIMPSEQKGNEATIELTATNGSSVTLSSITVELDASADTAWEAEGDFTCRGPLGPTCVFITSFELTFNKDLDKNFRGTRKVSSSIIDTTVPQSLDMVGTLTGASSFQTRLLTLTRVF